MTGRAISRRDILVDLRALQDPDYVGRGVGRHAVALLRHAPGRDGGVRFVGLVDPSLPGLAEDARELVAETHTNAYSALQSLGSRASSAPFLALSPMTADPLFNGRFLAERSRMRVAVVYDFIPRRWPERYLSGLPERLRYATQLRWLARCDTFAAISHSAAADLVNLLGVSTESVAVTGAPLDPAFETARSLARGGRKHILFVGGGDWRKNPDVVIAAHAASRVLQDVRTPLVLAGQYPPAAADQFRGLSTRAGGRPELIRVPGGLAREELIGLYADAIAVVCASYDEGFSLPVVEGMAAGIPVIVSDIPAHRELVSDPALRFPPGDPTGLQPLLEKATSDRAWCAEIVAAQDPVWPRFRAAEVGRRFWEHFPFRDREPAPMLVRRAKPRVAVLSPLPPAPSGVADYTAATCASLAELVDLHVFTETERPLPIEGVAIQAFSALPAVAPGFDRVVHVVGNSHFHLRTFDILLRYGGAAIAHDARMLGFYRIHLGLERALHQASKELGRPVSESELGGWLADESRLETLFLDEVMDAASPMIVHSRITAQQLANRRGRSPVFIPFSIYRAWSAESLTARARATAKARMGIAPNELAIVTFGSVHENKAPEECIWALDVLRGWGIRARLCFLGTMTSPHLGAWLRELIGRLGLGDQVEFTDFVSDAAYRDALAGADVAIQLRTYALGGLSGAMLDCAAAGLPTVSNRSLAEAVETPTEYFTTIPDALSPVLIAKAVADLAEMRADDDANSRREAARSAFCQARSMSLYARGLCEALGLEAAVRAPRSPP